MPIVDIPQRSEEWLAFRTGKLGASSLADALAKTKTGWGASRANLMSRLIIERLTGKPQETYQNAAMLTGIEREPEARAAYALDRDCDVIEIGCFTHPTIEDTLASPDGVIDEKGVLELKCPQPAAHLDILLTGAVPEKYVLQMLWQMACGEREWADFVSYNPDFPPHMQLFIKRIERDDARIAQLERDVREFLSELEEKLGVLKSRYPA